MTATVLVIESEPWLGDHYQRVLEKHDFTVIRAPNANAAIDRLDSQIPAAIIMSLSLTGSLGLTLLHELQTYTDTGHVPVIVCSNLRQLNLDELYPYGVRRLIDSTTMLPDDLAVAVRSVTQ